MLINKIVIGVSGGPDSMYLLNQLHNNPRLEPIVVHINYKFRSESDEEQEFVTKYCNDRNIKIHVTEVQESDWDKYKYLANKQSMARQLRYDKYFEVASQYNNVTIFIAQHKDDFIETAIMQERKSDDYLFYGIEESSLNNGYKIHRPLIEKWKSEIIEEMDSNNLEYRIDKSNFEPIYERNKIRLELSELTIDQKEQIYNKFVKINKDKENLRNEVEKYYNGLKESEFDYNIYVNIPDTHKRYVIYKWLINNETRINISSDKLNAIIEFLNNKRGDKAFRLMENVFMSVKSGKIIIYT